MTARAAYPRLWRSYWSWIKAVAAEIRNEVRRESIDVDTGEVVEAYPLGDASRPTVRRAMESRASKLSRCMRRVEGHICGSSEDAEVGCGRPRSRGVFRMKEPRRGRRCRKAFSSGSDRCHLRSCPRCARVRAAVYHEYGAKLVERFERSKAEQIEHWGSRDYRPKLVTLTSHRDPSDKAAHTVAAMQARAAGLRDAFRAILAWNREDCREPGWLGAFVALENAGTGHIHLHVLYHGPFIDTDEHGNPVRWIAVGREGYTDKRGRVYPGFPELGSVGDVRIADDEAISEVAKYPLKSPGAGPGAAHWIAGQKKLVMHPVIAARWEIAAYGMRLCERYGICREVEPPKEDDPENPEIATPEAPAAPCECGCCETKVILYSTREWIALCDVAGVNPFGTIGAARWSKGENENGKRKREKRRYRQGGRCASAVPD